MRAEARTLPRPRRSADHDLLAGMRAGDEAAFAQFINRHHHTMLRVARGYVPSDALAEEVVQETWEAAIRGLDRFEGRSNVKTWLFRILINRAKSRGVAERRTVPFSALEPAGGGEAAVDPALFQGTDDRLPGSWAQPPRPWQDPERRLLSLEVREHMRAALDRLPPRQAIVVALRDVEGLAAEDVCALLGVSHANQRILLHRGRTALRRALDAVLGD